METKGTSAFDPYLAQLVEFFKQRVQQAPAPVLSVGGSVLRVDTKALPLPEIADRLVRRGILTPAIMAERALVGVDFDEEARILGITPPQVAALYQAALTSLNSQFRKQVEQAVAHPKGTGGLDLHDPNYERMRKQIGADKIHQLTSDEVKKWFRRPPIIFLPPLGPINAVDLRPFLGPARDQQGRGTCTSFGSTAVAEALEFFRDRRPGPRDYSEELIFWYSERGQLFTVGGYDGGVALAHYTQYGSSEEFYFPYWGQEISSNHAQAPAPDDAMDRAHQLKPTALVQQAVQLPVGDVDALKTVLSSGRCAVIATDTNGWNTGTGVITFPDPLNSMGPGSGHCVAAIGFIDYDNLPAHFEGGYFIIRNSWGGADSPSNLMGPEYGGHLLMPYGWYRRYTSSCATLAVQDEQLPTGRTWLAEFFPNASLEGTPLLVRTDLTSVHFDWGTGGPFEIAFPPFGTIDYGPTDYFSARFTQIRTFRPGWYRFTLSGDDGVRLWVDDRLVINAWKAESATSYTREHYLTGGDHVLRIEYFERTGVASVNFDVAPVLFHFDLYAEPDLSGSPETSFDDTITDLEWRHAPPVGHFVNYGQFSLRATADKTFDEGTYIFHALHTGGCRIWVDSTLVLDDWNGGNPDGAPVHLAAGSHHLRVEFRHLTGLPGPNDHTYYRAAVAFDWSDVDWRVSLYHDQTRQDIQNANYPHVDSLYEAFRTQGLTGDPIADYTLSANHSAPGDYYAQDGVPLVLSFGNLAMLGNTSPGGPLASTDWLGAHIRRRIWLSEAGRYTFTLSADDGYRLIVDGKTLLQDYRILGPDPANKELDLTAGIHDIAIEYENSAWDGVIDFHLERSAWNVDYYAGTNFDTYVLSVLADRIERILPNRPAAVGDFNYSVRAQRTIWLPLGRYRVQARADDGVRVKIGGQTLIDAWIDQPATSYWSYFEHRGGDVPIVLEYYQASGDAALEFVLVPEGFFGEYYHGITLEQAAPGSPLDRNVPIAYRYERTIDFDWGYTGRLPRIGARDYSARWTGPLDLPVGRWSIEVTADDGVRLFLNGQLLIESWQDQATTTHTKVVDLVGRQHELRLEYYHRAASATCRVAFQRQF